MSASFVLPHAPLPASELRLFQSHFNPRLTALGGTLTSILRMILLFLVVMLMRCWNRRSLA